MIGTVLGGRYQLDELVGRGGLGELWRCVDREAGRTLAAKLVRAPADDNAQVALRIELGWLRPMRTVDHPGVVHAHDSGVHPEAGPYVILDYIEAESLTVVLAREDRLSPARTMEVVAGIAGALAAVHERGILHRDLRPSKVLVRPDGSIVLSSFGLEFQARPPDFSAALIGRAGYLAPEQLMGNTGTYQSDIFSLGVLAYQCLTGRRPFDGDNPLEVAMRVVRDAPPPLPPDVPTAVRSIVERAMAKGAADRWPTATELAAAARGCAGQG